jgi:hypothetical protein
MYIFVALLALTLFQTAKAEPLPFPPSYQRLVNDTSASVLLSYQQGDRESLMNVINRDPLIARKVLISILRQSDKLEMARSLAELFPQSCASELEKPLFDFFLVADSDTRKRLLDQVELLTDSQYTFAKRDSSDRFSIRINDQALDHIRQTAGEFGALGFKDGEAYSLATWTTSRIGMGCVEEIDSRLETLENARSLYEEAGNLRGQSICLLHLARLNLHALQKRDKAAQLFLLACDKGKAESAVIFKHFLGQHQWLAEKTPVDWLKGSEALL